MSVAGFEPATRGLFCSLLEFSTCVFTFRHALNKEKIPESQKIVNGYFEKNLNINF